MRVALGFGVGAVLLLIKPFGLLVQWILLPFLVDLFPRQVNVSVSLIGSCLLCRVLACVCVERSFRPFSFERLPAFLDNLGSV